VIDIVTQIKDDHRKVEALFEKFEQGHGNRDKQRIAEQIIEELSLHASVEEQLIYPLIRMRDKGAEDAVLEALEEHHLAKTTLAELDEMAVEDERYEAKMTVLAESVRHHIEEEERDLLPKLERLTTDTERARIAEALPRLKELVPNHPHPMAPDTPPQSLFGGLLAKVLDTTKDIARLVIAPEKGRARMAAKDKRRREAAKVMNDARAERGASTSTSSPAASRSSNGTGSSPKRAATRVRGRVAAASGKTGAGQSKANRSAASPRGKSASSGTRGKTAGKSSSSRSGK
jgi:hemerythrin superfamily protein